MFWLDNGCAVQRIGKARRRMNFGFVLALILVWAIALGAVWLVLTALD
jgi:hypothetical protein